MEQTEVLKGLVWSCCFLEEKEERRREGEEKMKRGVLEERRKREKEWVCPKRKEGREANTCLNPKIYHERQKRE